MVCSPSPSKESRFCEKEWGFAEILRKFAQRLNSLCSLGPSIVNKFSFFFLSKYREVSLYFFLAVLKCSRRQFRMIADKLKDYRSQQGWSQDDLAEKMNISRSLVAKWEQGRANPTADDLDKLAGLFGAKPEDLASYKDLQSIYKKEQKKRKRVFGSFSFPPSLSLFCLGRVLLSGLHSFLLNAMPSRPPKPTKMSRSARLIPPLVGSLHSNLAMEQPSRRISLQIPQ